ncbi:MAG: DUF565 domain-containing protein [Gloeomargarita sp. SKYBB_i_bin120]|nr:DUF565 domain-containing protein [Gloeomargarita sp. SKYG98]MCS7292445.1 DUF565 domain-containing protein [Gloeomargarita sp. SKYB120]MDW8178006.1 DUF565 domain-containing protein [Gloeomargarita sp. SKYBB_i_bin120]
MQQTRLNQIADQVGQSVQRWVAWPLNRWLLHLVFLFGGAFLAASVSTSLGALAQLDTVGMLVLIAGTELISWWTYSRRRVGLLLSLLNTLKVGFMGGMYLDALKLGS